MNAIERCIVMYTIRMNARLESVLTSLLFVAGCGAPQPVEGGRTPVSLECPAYTVREINHGDWGKICVVDGDDDGRLERTDTIYGMSPNEPEVWEELMPYIESKCHPIKPVGVYGSPETIVRAVYRFTGNNGSCDF